MTAWKRSHDFGMTWFGINPMVSRTREYSKTIFIDYNMAFFISHLLSALGHDTSLRAVGSRDDTDHGLIWVWSEKWHIMIFSTYTSLLVFHIDPFGLSLSNGGMWYQFNWKVLFLFQNVLHTHSLHNHLFLFLSSW